MTRTILNVREMSESHVSHESYSDAPLVVQGDLTLADSHAKRKATLDMVQCHSSGYRPGG